jgi:hypothetical protein
MPVFGNVRDAQQSPLFDTYTAAGSASVANRIAFFNSNTQSSTGMEKTNMPAAGFLPPPQAFTVFGLAFSPIGCDPADVLALYKNYTARLIVGAKTYIEAPMEFFPAPGGLNVMYGTQTAAAGNIAVTNGIPAQSSVFNLGPDYAIKIESNERFEVNLVGTSGFTSTAAIFLRCYLLGVYERPVQ